MLSSHELVDVIVRLMLSNDWTENNAAIAAMQAIAQSALTQVYGESGYAMFNEAWETVTSNYSDGLMSAIG